MTGNSDLRVRWALGAGWTFVAVGVVACLIAIPGERTDAEPGFVSRYAEAMALSAGGPPPGEVATATAPRNASEPEKVSLPPAPERPMRLYEEHCAVCHGEQGRGDGPAARHIVQSPWSFEGAVFKWGTVHSGMATDDDLLHTLRRGIPGTAMPSHRELPDEDLRDLVEAVKYLALTTTAQRVREADPEMTGEEVLAYTRRIMTPGAPIQIPPRITRPGGAPSPGVKPGAFDRACAECHGADGTAAGPHEEPEELVDLMGFQDLPRNYTREVFRGGSTERDVALRMLRGIPGGAMAAAEITPENPEFWEVLDWVRHVNSGVDSEAAVQRRCTIAVHRAATVPETASDPAWADAPTVRLPLMPLRRSVDVPLAVDVRAVHDGRRAAFRLEWVGAAADSSDGPTARVSGAAVRVLADLPPGLPHGADAPGTVARWSSGAPAVSAASPPEWVPFSEIAANRVSGRGAGERAGSGVAVVLTLDLPDAASRDLVLGVWDGAADDGRLHEGVTIRHALDLRP